MFMPRDSLARPSSEGEHAVKNKKEKLKVKSTSKFYPNKWINRKFSALLKRFFVNFKSVFKNTYSC